MFLLFMAAGKVQWMYLAILRRLSGCILEFVESRGRAVYLEGQRS